MAEEAGITMDGAMLERLVRVETKLDMALDGQGRAIDDAKGDLSDAEKRLDRRLTEHDTRIRRIERAVWIAAGIAAAVGSAIGSTLGGVLGIGS